MSDDSASHSDDSASREVEAAVQSKKGGKHPRSETAAPAQPKAKKARTEAASKEPVGRVFERRQATGSSWPKEVTLAPAASGGGKKKGEDAGPKEPKKKTPVVVKVGYIGGVFQVPPREDGKPVDNRTPRMTINDIKATKVKGDDLSYGTDSNGVLHHWTHTFITSMDEPQTEIPASQLNELRNKKRGSGGIPDEPMVPPLAAAEPRPALDKPITSASGRVTNIQTVRPADNKDEFVWEANRTVVMASSSSGLNKKGSTPARTPAAPETVKPTPPEVAAALASLPVEDGRRIAAAYLEANATNRMKHLFNIIKRKNPGMSSLNDKIGLLAAVEEADAAGKDFKDAIAACIAELPPNRSKDAEDPTKEKMLPLSNFLENALAVVRDAWTEIGGSK